MFMLSRDSCPRRYRCSRRRTVVSAATGVIVLSLLLSAHGRPTAATDDDKEGVVAGIHLGMASSTIAIVHTDAADCHVEVLRDVEGRHTIASYVAWDTEGGVLVGDAAKAQAMLNPAGTVYDMKRLIGRKFKDPSVQAGLSSWQFKVVAVHGGGVGVSVPTGPTSHTILTPEDVVAMVLQELKSTAEARVGQPVEKAVITVPVHFNDDQRMATRKAGKAAGFDVLRIINEPMAAGLAYGWQGVRSEQNVLVFQLDGGSLDVTALEIDSGVYEAMAVAGDAHIGGDTFTARTVAYFVKRIKAVDGHDVAGDARAMQQLQAAVERAIHQLSTDAVVSVEVHFEHRGFEFTGKLTRQRFEELNRDLFHKSLGAVRGVMAAAGWNATDVNEVVLAGGFAGAPKVYSMLGQYFEGHAPINVAINPVEVVSWGAAVGAQHIVANDACDMRPLSFSIMPLSLGIEAPGGVFERIIPRNVLLPRRTSLVFTVDVDEQASFTVKVLEGERAMAADNRELARLHLTGLKRGLAHIDVTFEVDVEGMLYVTARDSASGSRNETAVEWEEGQLSFEAIEEAVLEAERFSVEDGAARERALATVPGLGRQAQEDDE